MGTQKTFVGIDVGTTGVRCLIFDESGGRLAHAYRTYPLEVLSSGWVEQSVPLMLATTMTVCREAVASSTLDRSTIASVGFSTQMCCTIACRTDGSFVRPMISWQDTRAKQQTQTVQDHIDAEAYSRLAGYPLSSHSPLMKILWLREHEPEHYNETERWLQLHQVLLHVFGADGFFGDTSEANFTGMWDVAAQQWDPGLLSLAGLSEDSLGSLVAGGTRVGSVSARAATKSGLPEGTPLCVGAGDQICGVIGLGSTETDIATLTLGTSGFLNRVFREPPTDLPGVTMSNHVEPDRWVVSSAMTSAASSLDWFRATFGAAEVANADRKGTDPYDELTSLAAETPPGSEGVVFLPYLNSAGAPRWNPDARAVFLGMTQKTPRSAFARAVLEGVAFEFRDNLRHWADYGVAAPEVARATGGAMRSDLWAQILSDIIGLPIERTREPEAACLGAAMLGAIGIGYYSSLGDAAQAMVHTASVVAPNAANREVFDTAFNAYLSAADRLFGDS